MKTNTFLVVGLILMSTGCRTIAPVVSEPEDLSIKFEHTVCSDDTEMYSCKPRIMHAIEEGNFDLVQEVIDGGLDVNTHFPYYYGKTALQHAVHSGEVIIALYLLDQGADPSERIPLDPLQTALDHGYAELVEEMEKRMIP